MSPEQAAGREDIDGRADIWSLGVVMYEALTGTLPHQAANYNQLMVRILTQDCDPVQHAQARSAARACAPSSTPASSASATRAPPTRACSRARWRAALREMRAVRFRALGRRAADRNATAGAPRSSAARPIQRRAEAAARAPGHEAGKPQGLRRSRSATSCCSPRASAWPSARWRSCSCSRCSRAVRSGRAGRASGSVRNALPCRERRRAAPPGAALCPARAKLLRAWAAAARAGAPL